MMKKVLKSWTFWLTLIATLICLNDALYENSRFMYQQHLGLALDPLYSEFAFSEPYRSLFFEDAGFLKALPLAYYTRIGLSLIYGLIIDFIVMFIRKARTN
ncbi:hypothetical protein ACQCN2_06590 [Brevibacillus ginsengisoli]|uniref:hypothetical protein n=1 Tax=Brevibacillus ginsengisoli TaxID=363854 RepID=UPI003CE6A153